ncbi:MAG: hypothetical protein COB35_12470 [Gammaproteobacteria bacterium]|nr:MAG: hypothetical protein COB35_12470 [Gammaproteobacteria bacterium]
MLSKIHSNKEIHFKQNLKTLHRCILLFFFISIITYSLKGVTQNISSKKENFSFINSYQYSYINEHINKPKDKIIEQIKLFIQNNNHKDIKQYFAEHNFAYILFKKHQKEATIKKLDQTIALAKSISLDSYHVAKSLLLRAKTYGILFRNTPRAIKDLKQAITSNEQSQHPQKVNLQFDLQTAMAQAFNQLGQLTKAQQYSQQALNSAKQLNDNNETIYALIIAGRIAFQQDKFDQAYQFFFQALQRSDEKTPKKQIASIELRLAIAYESQNIYEQALVHAKKAATLYSELSEERLQIKSLRVLGNIYLSLGHDIDTALVHFINGLTIAKEIKSNNYIGQMQYLIGKSYLLDRQLTKAKKYLNSAQNILELGSSKFYLALNAVELAKLAEETGQSEHAINLVEHLKTTINLTKYPSLNAEINQYLLSLYVKQQKFKAAYQLQQKMFTNVDLQKSLQNEQMIKKFDHDVEIKTLTTRLNESKKKVGLAQAKLNDLTNKNTRYLMLLLLAAIVIIITYLQYRKWYKTYQKRCKNSFLTWSAFKKKVIIKASKNNNFTIIACASKDDIDQQSVQPLTPELSLMLCNEASLHHNVIWHICENNQQKIKQKLNSFVEHASMPLFNLSLPLNNFPQNISDHYLQLIEQLIILLMKKVQTDQSVMQARLIKINIEAQALPLIFSSNNEQSINDGINEAMKQELINTKTIQI